MKSLEYYSFHKHFKITFVFSPNTADAQLMMSNLSIGENGAAPVPQTRAPAVTRRATFNTTGKDDEQSSGVLDNDNRTEISAQER